MRYLGVELKEMISGLDPRELDFVIFFKENSSRTKIFNKKISQYPQYPQLKFLIPGNEKIGVGRSIQ